MIVLDANVVIAYLDGENVHHRRAQSLLVREIDEDLGINPLTLAEVLVAPAREDRLGDAQQALRALDVREIPFPDDTAGSLARLRASTRLRMPGCCVLLTAEDVGARLASFDDRLVSVAAGRGLDVLSH